MQELQEAQCYWNWCQKAKALTTASCRCIQEDCASTEQNAQPQLQRSMHWEPTARNLPISLLSDS